MKIIVISRMWMDKEIFNLIFFNNIYIYILYLNAHIFSKLYIELLFAQFLSDVLFWFFR